MSDPTTSTTTATPIPPAPPPETAEALQAQLDQLRQRSVDLHAAADRAGANRYAQRGAALDDATREAASARQEAATARRQAAREREVAQKHTTDAEDMAGEARRPGADVRFAQHMAERERAHARAAEERAERLERIAAERSTQADDLDQRVTELEEAVGDESVASTIREAALDTESAADQLVEKVRLLSMAESMERDAADYEARGDTLSAELHRGQATKVRADAAAIRPEIPEIDQRILDAADQPWHLEPPTPPGPVPAPVPPTEPVDNRRPVDPYAMEDADGDGLSDLVEHQLGLDPRNDDSDGDKLVDGIEVAVPFHNPRVRAVEDLDPETAQAKADSILEWEARRGLAHNADSNDDGFADWISAMRGLRGDPRLTADDITNNLSPLDQFVKSAQDQVGKPYRFGAEVDPAANLGGDAYDSSELVEWAAKQAGVRDMPDGSWNQYRWLHQQGASMSVEEALRTKGALVFGFSSDPLASPDRPARAYVAISLGDGTVLDVSERAGQVRVMEPGNFFGYAAKIPELHEPVGDFDGDGWTDQQEIEMGGDPSRGITLPQFEFADPAGADPTGAGDPVDPGRPVDPVDPLGTDRYDDDAAPAPAPAGGPGGPPAYDDPYAGGSSYGPGAGGPPTDTGTGAYGPAPGAAHDGPTEPGPAPAHGDAGAYADSSGPVDPGAGEPYGDSDAAATGPDDSYAHPDAPTYD